MPTSARVPTRKVKAISEYLTLADFTDNTNTTGYCDFDNIIPANSLVLGWKAVTKVAFVGDSSATLQVGVSGNLDQFSAITNSSVFTATTKASNAPGTSDTNFVIADTTPRVTVTSGSDFGLITAGGVWVTIYYIQF